LRAWGGGEGCETNWPTEIVEIAHFMNSMKMIDSSLPPATDIWFTSTDIHTHFTVKGHKGWHLRKMPEVRIKLDTMIKDLLFFQIYII
jgi:hypothetical protein